MLARILRSRNKMKNDLMAVTQECSCPKIDHDGNTFSEESYVLQRCLQQRREGNADAINLRLLPHLLYQSA